MNRMIQKRNVLVSKLKDIIDSKITGFNYADRLRRETFDSYTRQQRIQVMGDPTQYCEVLFTGYSDEQKDAGGNVILDNFNYRVNVWFAYKDDVNYDYSSQFIFDSLCFDADGIIPTIEEANLLPEQTWNMGIDGLEQLIVSLDNEGTELAHFLTFNITLR